VDFAGICRGLAVGGGETFGSSGRLVIQDGKGPDILVELMKKLEILADGASALGVELNDLQLGQFQTYLDGLAEWNRRTNLTSTGALANAERVHLLDSLTLAPVMRREAPNARRLVDVGSGAGFPGLALKIALPDLEVVLVESTGKKAEFLRWMTNNLGLGDVEVLTDRAEAVGRRVGYRETFDVATARAVGQLKLVMELTLPLCKIGGVLIAQRGGDAEEESVLAVKAAATLGAGDISVEPTPVAGSEARGFITVARKLSATSDRFPRRDGIPAKRPLA
jgi:16S rRNA (guanine527-N7)-methyltransferase